jgi:hypothetical protein
MKDEKRYDPEVSDTTMMIPLVGGLILCLDKKRNYILDIRHKKTIYLDEFI